MKRKEAEKFLPLIKAFSEGRAIEYKSVNGWIETSEPNWVTDTEYRIKSQPKLIPFTFEDNLSFRDKWVGIDRNLALYKIVRVSTDGILIFTSSSANFVSYEELFNDYEFEDGSKCGKYINE